MSKRIQQVLSAFIVAGIVFFHHTTHSFTNKSSFLPRSQVAHSDRRLSGVMPYSTEDILWGHQRGDLGFYWAIITAFSRSTDPERLADYLFGDRKMVFSGSQHPHRNETDILADYLGLPMDFQSTVCLEPRISSTQVNFDFRWDFNAWCAPLYISVYFPVVYSNFDLHFWECVTDKGVLGYPAGYMAADAIPRKKLPIDVEEAFEGNRVWGDLATPFHYGKISAHRQTHARFADTYVDVGCHYVSCPRFAGDVYGRVVFPAGNKPCGEFMFESIVGNGHFWEVGGGTNGSIILSSCESSCSSFSVCWDVWATHLFASCRNRSYDFKTVKEDAEIGRGPGSRYMLLADMSAQSQNLYFDGPGVTRTESQYASKLVHAINVTTLCSQIAIDYQLELLLKGLYTGPHWVAEIGYNFWTRAKEKLQGREVFPADRYVIKGDAFVSGFVQNSAQPKPLLLSQDTANINTGRGANSVDSPSQLFDHTGKLELAHNVITATPVNGSRPMRFLNDDDIEECGALAPRALSNTFFAYLGYSAYKDAEWVASAGLGGSYEMARTDAHNSAFSQWCVWLKASIMH